MHGSRFYPAKIKIVYMLLLLTLGCFFFACSQTSHQQSNQGWGQVAEIIDQIVLPQFPDLDFLITDFGAAGDSMTDCHPAFVRAVLKCNSTGGGRVVVPAGVYLTNGPIHLKSNVHLYLSKGAKIVFSGNPDDFLPVVLTRWEGTELFNYSPLIYAYQATNVAITGEGIIDGGARQSFAQWKPQQKPAQAKLRQLGNDGIPVNERVFGPGHWLRPSMIQPFGCKNVLIEGITIIDSPFWVIHPTYCLNVTVRNVHVESWNPNNDGCDPDASVNVLIENCVFNTGDDAVAIKSGRDQDGWRVGQAAENVVIRNCDMKSKANGLCIGSEMSGGVRNIFMEDCRVDEAGSAVYFKSNLDRGGVIENVWVRNITVNRAKFAFIRFETNYKGHRGNRFPPRFRKFYLESITCKTADRYGIYAVGHHQSRLQDIYLSNITVDSAKVPLLLKYAENFETRNVIVNGKRLPAVPKMTANEGADLNMSW